MPRLAALLLLAASCAVPAVPAAAKGRAAALPSLAEPAAAALVGRFLVAFSAKDMATIQLLMHNDIVLRMQFAPDAPMTLRGRAQATAYFKAVFDRYARITIGEVTATPAADGRTVTVETTGTYETPGGEAHGVTYVWIVSADGGRIRASRNYTLPVASATTR